MTTVIQAISRAPSIGGRLGQQDLGGALERVVGVVGADRDPASGAAQGRQCAASSSTAALARSNSAAARSTPPSSPGGPGAPRPPLSSPRDEHLPRHRGRRIPRLAHVRPPAPRRPPGDLRRQPRHRLAAERRAHPRRRLRLRPARPHRALLHRRADRLRLPPRLAGEPDRLPAPAAAHAQGRLLRHPPHARPGEAEARPLRARPRPPRSTATPRSIPSPRPTGATSTRSARAASTTRPSATPRR